MSVSPRSVIEHVIESISPASEAQAAAARDRIGDGADGTLAALAVRLAAARHAPRPRVERKAVVVVLGDHGVADPGIDLGPTHPTAVAAAAIASGAAALTDVARRAGAKVLIVDAGATGPVPSSAVGVGRGPAADITRGAALTPVDTVLAVEGGIAVAIALADDGLDVLALGAVGLGAEIASAALVAAVTGAPVSSVARPDDASAVEAALAANPIPGAVPLEILATFGGGDHAVLVGMILAAASMDVPIVLDDHATAAAALVAVALAPAVAGYLVAAHGGTQPSHRRALAALGLTPLFELGLARGEGTGAALALPLVDGAAALIT